MADNFAMRLWSLACVETSKAVTARTACAQRFARVRSGHTSLAAIPSSTRAMTGRGTSFRRPKQTQSKSKLVISKDSRDFKHHRPNIYLSSCRGLLRSVDHGSLSLLQAILRRTVVRVFRRRCSYGKLGLCYCRKTFLSPEKALRALKHEPSYRPS